MIRHNKTSVTISNDDWEDFLNELTGLQKSYHDEHLENCYMFHFIRYYNLDRLYNAFKAAPPEDDPDDTPFESYKSFLAAYKNR